MGERIRRQNLKKQRELIETLENHVKVLERQKTAAENMASLAEGKFHAKSRELENVKENRKSDNSWLKFVYRSMQSESKKDFKLSVIHNKEQFTPGTMSRLRESSGVNFSQIPIPVDIRLSALAKKVGEFALLNSSEIPDMRANKSVFSQSKIPNKRFSHHHLTVLHTQYEIDNPDFPVSYSGFCKHWPSYIIKPKASDFTSCHCQICDNAGSKCASLQSAGLLDDGLEVFEAIKMAEEGDSEFWDNLNVKLAEIKTGPKKANKIIFSQWEKVEKQVGEERSNFNKENGRKGKNTVDKKLLKSSRVDHLVEKCQKDFAELRDHLHRSKTIKIEIAKEKEKVLNDSTGKTALVWVDWSQSLEMHQVEEVQSAFFGCASISLQSGYIFHNSYSAGFGSFSECKGHKVLRITRLFKVLY